MFDEWYRKREANDIISNSTGGKEMQVNKVIYILLALFLGSFGIHKFYAGRICKVFYT